MYCVELNCSIGYLRYWNAIMLVIVFPLNIMMLNITNFTHDLVKLSSVLGVKFFI